jgi:hypothetical protein
MTSTAIKEVFGIKVSDFCNPAVSIINPSHLSPLVFVIATGVVFGQENTENKEISNLFDSFDIN